MTKIFISYRREDSADVTGRIGDWLRDNFGEEQIFTDVDNIPLGVDFRTHLDNEVSQCDVLLVVIGKDWLSVKNSDGELRLNDPVDFVRIEIESALRRDIPVIPLLVRGASIPQMNQLPKSIEKLAFRNALRIRPDPDFNNDVNRLVQSLIKHFEPDTPDPVSTAPDSPEHADEILPGISDMQALNIDTPDVPSHQRWHPLVAGYPPAWVTGWGEDEYGIFVDVKLSGSRFRMRWIPAGQFFIGSSRIEPGRYEDESHRVQISFTKGYWLMDTPVTQALWQVVMEENPSRFQSSDRPVEGVSWDEVQDFLLKMNERVAGLSLRLPSESEWEYACRAGTEEATYAGAIEIKGERNAPVLDAIAWYGGNSGIEFELEEGHDSSEWPEKQHEHSKAGTHPVRKKRPNRWGCYDMLGNVWEWCEDVWSESHEGIDINGAARVGSSDEKGIVRVVRGGSWGSDARVVRAACRFGFEPDFRDVDLGFRCVQGQSSSVARDERLLAGSVAEPRPLTGDYGKAFEGLS